ncbi:Multiple C2 and transmembrane domain-containing protein 2, partial [Lunasporangiospora selenospora]
RDDATPTTPVSEPTPAAAGCKQKRDDSPIPVPTNATYPDPSAASSRNMGTLLVRLNYASNLKNRDWIGKSDPFVELWLDKKYKSRSKQAKGLNPVFQETFSFSVRSGQDSLYVRVVDRDTFWNDKIGSEGPRDYKLPRWFGLRDNGSVNMQLQFTPNRG